MLLPRDKHRFTAYFDVDTLHLSNTLLQWRYHNREEPRKLSKENPIQFSIFTNGLSMFGL